MLRLSCKNQPFIQLYNQDSSKVPIYYSRPGPGMYESEVNFGQSASASKVTNAPGYSIPKTRSFKGTAGKRAERYVKAVKTD